MKILIIARGIPSKRDPQEGCFEWDQAKAIKALGHEPVVLALDARFRKDGHKFGVVYHDIDGIPFYQGYWMTISVIERLISKRLAYRLYRHFISRIFRRVLADHPDIDVVHSHFLFSTYNIIPAIRESRLPLVATEHWSVLERDTLDPIIRHLGNEAFPEATKVISVSQSLKNRIQQHFGVDSIVVHNMIGPEFENAHISEKHRHTDDKFHFVSTGSLIPRKGFDVAIRAFKESGLAGRATYSIIGGGPLRKELQQLIDSLGLHESVKLLGKKQKTEIVDILTRSDAFILPSRAENFSVAVLEALALGLPAIATVCGGIRECINQNNGLLVEVDNVKKMAGAMLDMVRNYSRYDNNSIRERCLTLYGPTTIAKGLVKVYEEAIKNTK